MIRLGITGGIGSGKSYVSQLLSSQFGIPVYDCDREAKRLTATDSGIREALQKLVGRDVYTEDGALDKTILTQYLFASADHATLVNAIIHPVVRMDFRSWCQQQQSEVVAMESAILYESGFDSEVDKVLLVDAPLETRIQRAMLRDGSSREQVVSRIALQDGSLAREKAEFLLQNDGRPINDELQTIINIIKC